MAKNNDKKVLNKTITGKMEILTPPTSPRLEIQK